MAGFMPCIIGILLIGNSLYQYVVHGANMLGPCLSGAFLLIVGIILHWYFANEKILTQMYKDHYLNDLHR